MIIRHQGTSASAMGELKDAFDEPPLDPQIAFLIEMVTRETAVTLNDTAVPGCPRLAALSLPG